jgi:molybdopterin/thiamine biosynthesis adenylyltransferase
MEKNNQIIVQICGAGGIGSNLAYHLDKLIELNQITGSFTFYDDDIVELKNILYQNFKTYDIDSKKTDALSLRYVNLKFRAERLTKDMIKNTNLLLLCVDNNATRQDAWEVFQERNIPFIDARSNGKVFGLFSSDTPNYLSTLGQSKTSSSCQNPFQIAKKQIEYGNVIVATLLAQAVLNYTRNNCLPNDLMISM